MLILSRRDNVIEQRVVVALRLTIDQGISTVTLRLRTENVQELAAVGLRLRTFDPSLIVPPESESTTAWVITHEGLPVEAVEYSISSSIDGGAKPRLPQLNVTLRGKVELEKDLSITVTVARKNKVFRQTYGPFGVLGYTFEKRATGWVTVVNSVDTTEADVADEDAQIEFDKEFLVWEKENDLTDYQRAVKQRQEALEQEQRRRRIRQRENQLQEQLQSTGNEVDQKRIQAELCRLRKSADKPKDYRRASVKSVLQYALNAMGIPYELKRALPYEYMYFYADEDTGRQVAWGRLKGVSFKTKGKTPIQVVKELLEPVGWQVIIRHGVAYVGPSEELLDAGFSAGLLEIDPEFLITETQELINPNLDNAGGNAQLPRKITLKGASAVNYLPPIDLPDETEDDPEGFAFQQSGTLTTSGEDIGYDVSGVRKIMSRWTSTKYKSQGVLSRETYRKDGWVPAGRQTDGRIYLVPSWVLIEDSEIKYLYTNPRFPQALTKSTSTKTEYIVALGAAYETETSETTNIWDSKGYLQRKLVSRKIYADWRWDGFVGGTPTHTINYETVSEEYLQVTANMWQITRIKTGSSRFAYYGDDDQAIGTKRTVKTTREIIFTDQSPPRASIQQVDYDCENLDQGFPYDETLEVEYSLNGRARSVEYTIPWATRIDSEWYQWIIARTRRARPAKRTRYQMTIPPKIELGTRVREFQITGKAASVRANVVMEEALDG